MSDTNRGALEITLSELDRMGRLERVDAAQVQALRSMAESLDEKPFNSQMWKVYGEAIERLTADDSGDGNIDELLDELSPVIPLRDSSSS